MSLEGRVAIVTGAGRGIGRETCLVLAERGCWVVAAVRDPDSLSAQQLKALTGKVTVYSCDVASQSAVANLISDCVSRFGRLDILVNNAGTIQPIGRIVDTEPASWLAGLTTNLAGPYYLIREAIPHFGKGGVIVNLSSGAAHQPREGWSAYCSSKAGLAMLTRSVTHEYGSLGVRCYGFQPGVVDTEMQGLIRESGMNEISRLRRDQLRPASDPACVIAYLCSAEAADLAGSELSIADAELCRRAGLMP